MDLETYQRSLYRLVVYGKPLPDDPSYTQELVGSSRLEVVQDVIYFWRAYGLENFCFLTATWLKRLGRFEADIKNFVTTGGFSPFVEESGIQFLHYMANDRDPIVAALANLELALHETRLDLSEERIVEWPCEPEPILSAILDKSESIKPLDHRRYRVRVSRSFPGSLISELIE